MSTTTTRVVAAVVALAMVLAGLGVALTLFFGGGDSGRSSGPAPTTTPEPGATEAPSPELDAFYGQELDWSACERDDDLECATLTVPVDYTDPGGDTVGIALLKLPATRPSERIGSLVVNPGGPGAPGTSYAAAAGVVFRPALYQRYDIVGFDPRGTGSSDPVDCVSDEELDAFLSLDPAPDEEVPFGSSIEVTVSIGPMPRASSLSWSLSIVASTMTTTLDPVSRWSRASSSVSENSVTS